MANVKISQLPSLSTMTDLAQIPVVAGGTTYQITGSNLSSYFSTSAAGSKIVNGSTEANIGASGGNANISVGGISNVAVFTQSGVIVSGVLTAPVLTTNNIRSDDSSFVNIEDGVNVTGAVIAAGNVVGNYFIGNGSQLTGLAPTYGNANVVANLAALGTNPVSTTGNITGGYIFGNGSQLTGITGNLDITGTTIEIAAGAAETVLEIRPDNSPGWAYLKLPNDATSNTVDTQLNNDNGNVSIGTGGDQFGVFPTWLFDNTGNLTLPEGGSLFSQSSTPSGSPGNTIVFQPAGSGVTTGQKLMIYPTAGDGDHIHLTSGNLYQTELFLGSDNFYVKLANTGDIVVQTDGGVGLTAQWTFGSGGTLTAPGQITVPSLITNSIRSDDSSFVNIEDGVNVTGAVVASGNIAGNYFIGNGSQLTGISAGANIGNVTFSDQIVVGTGTNDGSGGLYLAPGTNSTANLQYLRVRGGDVATHIHLDTGNNAYFDQYFGDDGKYVKLANTGNVVIGSDNGIGNSAQWTFDPTGELTVPGPISGLGNDKLEFTANSGAVFSGSNGNTISIYTNDGDIGGSADINIYTNTAGPGSSYKWTFSESGRLTLPNNTILKDTVDNAIAFGYEAGLNSQATQAVAIGTQAGYTSQGANAVAIGTGAGETSQGTQAVAIGARAGLTNQGNNSIILNATGANLDQTTANTFTVAPVRNDVANVAQVMFYNTTSKEITYGNTISVAGNITGGNLLTGGLISATSNVSGGNLNAAGLSLSGNVVSAINTTANITTTANISGGYILGNGSQLTGLPATYGNANVVANLAALGTNPVSTTGNITGGNLITAGAISAASVSASGNITGGNIVTDGIGGNISGANIISGTTLSATANVVGGNIITAAAVSAASVSASGNITGGNVLGGANVNATTHTGTTVSVTGNITGGNLAISGNSATITSANYSVGYLTIPQISFAANATAALVDSGKHYYSTSASNLALTLADNSAVSWPVGTALSIVNRGTANITVAPAAGVSLYLAGNATSGNRTVTTYGMATVMNVAANIWMISGTVV